MYEYGTREVSGVDNDSRRASWTTTLSEPVLTDGVPLVPLTFTHGPDGWDPLPRLLAASPH